MLPSIEELNQMMKMDIKEADRDELVDLRDVTIDVNKPVVDRVRSYIESVKNPYLVKIGDYVVKFSYQQSGESLDDRMISFISQMTKIKG